MRGILSTQVCEKSINSMNFSFWAVVSGVIPNSSKNKVTSLANGFKQMSCGSTGIFIEAVNGRVIIANHKRCIEECPCKLVIQRAQIYLYHTDDDLKKERFKEEIISLILAIDTLPFSMIAVYEKASLIFTGFEKGEVVCNDLNSTLTLYFM